MLSHALPLLAATVAPPAAMLAAAAAPDSSIAPYVGGGAGVVAVMALGEVTRRLLNGRLIPRETRDAEAETAAYIVAAGQREDRAMKVVEDANKLAVATATELKLHNERLAAELTATNARMTRAFEDLTDEIRSYRRTMEGR